MSIQESFVPQPYALKDIANKESLLIDTWKGNLGLSVFGSKEVRGVKFRRNINFDIQVLIRRKCEQLLTADVNTKIPIIISKYNRETKKLDPDYIITLVKDEKGVMHMEINGRGTESTVQNKFTFMMPYGITIGTDPMKDHQSSEERMYGFIEWLRYVMPLNRGLSNEKYVPPANKGAAQSDSTGSEYF